MAVHYPDHFHFTVAVNPAPAHGELSVLFSGEGRPYSAHSQGPALRDYYLVHTVISGEGCFETGGRRYACKSGDTFVIFPGELFFYEADKQNPWHYVWVAFVGHASESLLSSIGITLQQPVIRRGEADLFDRYRELRNGLLHADTVVLADLEAKGHLRLLLHAFGKANRSGISAKQLPPSEIERQIAHAIQWLSVQFNQPVSIELMSRTLGYHRTHLSKMFKRVTGLSPMQYLLKIRMERASALLLESRLTIVQVAASVGFTDAFYFSKQFHKWSGQSPTSYRESHRSY
ncbi:AraC family transcriptional regulator [Paenibacillus beijingensis]|uniref:AraC family transcriptional regulator n=1 Tax=Paenibacillus beijingensis TaxID=1126833 RepID=A0A0D5NH83_9BACL|nr:AraC family transcriptional regulator [Paenibacillus beijingensis]AJY74327.1 AraC family transcriptional regulator [Paenibacillus beijingensis]